MAEVLTKLERVSSDNLENQEHNVDVENQTPLAKNVDISYCNDMELTTVYSVDRSIHVFMQQTIASAVDMDVTSFETNQEIENIHSTQIAIHDMELTTVSPDDRPITSTVDPEIMSVLSEGLKSVPKNEHSIKVPSGQWNDRQPPVVLKDMEISTQEVEMSLVQEDAANQTSQTISSAINLVTSPIEKLDSISGALGSGPKTAIPVLDVDPVPSTTIPIVTSRENTKVPAKSLFPQSVITKLTAKETKDTEEVAQIQDFLETWKPEFGWEVQRKDGELMLTKFFGCVTLRLELNYEFLCHNVKHYYVDEVEFDTKRGTSVQFYTNKCVAITDVDVYKK